MIWTKKQLELLVYSMEKSIHLNIQVCKSMYPSENNFYRDIAHLERIELVKEVDNKTRDAQLKQWDLTIEGYVLATIYKNSINLCRDEEPGNKQG